MRLRHGAAVAVFGFAAVSRAQICQPAWSTEFGPGDPVGLIRAQAVFDDGTGPKLYAAGAYGVWRGGGGSWAETADVGGGGTRPPAGPASYFSPVAIAGPPNPPILVPQRCRHRNGRVKSRPP